MTNLYESQLEAQFSWDLETARFKPEASGLQPAALPQSYHASVIVTFIFLSIFFLILGLPWFKKILNLTLPEPRDININPKNCIGTVLSVNGHRRYFCMYHAKHPEGNRKKLYTANNGAAGLFILSTIYVTTLPIL